MLNHNTYVMVMVIFYGLCWNFCFRLDISQIRCVLGRIMDFPCTACIVFVLVSGVPVTSGTVTVSD